MTLNIRDPEVHELARAVAAATGETMTQAVKQALRERLDRVRAVGEAERERRVRDILAWAAEWRAAPVLDPRSFDEILGYDEDGLPS
jgi:antitoxin VapB